MKAARLAPGLLQAELAACAGLSRDAVNALEQTGQSTLGFLVRVVQVSALADGLQDIFKPPPPRSIVEMGRKAQGGRR